MCTGEDEELRDTCAPQNWHGIDADPGVFQKLICFVVMKEVNCKAVSTCSSCDVRTKLGI